MTLLDRVSLFFLAALGLCLGGYSLVCYGLIRSHLYHQFDQQLRNSINVLVASVEVETDGVKWQPLEHTIELGEETAADEVRWVLLDDRGAVIDRSPNLQASTAAEKELIALARSGKASPDEPLDTQSWRLLQKRLTTGSPEESSPPLGDEEPENDGEQDGDEFAAITVAVARDVTKLNSSLRRLAGLLTVLPMSLWLLAMVVGRSYCRRALDPLHQMSVQAQSMTEADFQLRLPVGHHRDELAKLAASFNGLLDQLQQAFEKQRRFTGDAAHQLRTPITVLKGEIDVTLRRPRSEEEYRQVLIKLGEQTEELRQIVEALLFLARAEGESLLPELETITFSCWLTHLLELQQQPRLKIVRENLDPTAIIRTSPPLLAQALDNLLHNALKYSPPESQVTLRIAQDREHVVLAVEDCGPGIPLEEREMIFDPFYRSPAARKSGAEGIGLGLTLVARIACAIGGTVRYEPNLPNGSRFLLELPLASS